MALSGCVRHVITVPTLDVHQEPGYGVLPRAWAAGGEAPSAARAFPPPSAYHTILATQVRGPAFLSLVPGHLPSLCRLVRGDVLAEASVTLAL